MSQVFSKTIFDLPEAVIPINGIKSFLMQDIRHSGKIYTGYADMTYFNQSGRKEKNK